MALPMKKTVKKAMKASPMKALAMKGMKAGPARLRFELIAVPSPRPRSPASGNEEESRQQDRPRQAGEDGRLQGSQGDWGLGLVLLVNSAFVHEVFRQLLCPSES